MRRLCAALAVLAGISMTLSAADPALVGNWVGSVDTDRGQMEIGLSVETRDGKLVGALKTAHGDWDVTGIQEKAGVWTVSFKGGGNEGRMVGRVADGKFSGEWKSAVANGTFEMVRPKKRG